MGRTRRRSDFVGSPRNEYQHVSGQRPAEFLGAERTEILPPCRGAGRTHAGLNISRFPDDARKKFLGAGRTETSSAFMGIGRKSAELKIGGTRNEMAPNIFG